MASDSGTKRQRVDEWEDDPDSYLPVDDDVKSLREVVEAFRFYESTSLTSAIRFERSMKELADTQRNRLPASAMSSDRFDNLRKAIRTNAQVLSQITSDCDQMFMNARMDPSVNISYVPDSICASHDTYVPLFDLFLAPRESNPQVSTSWGPASGANNDRVRTTLRQIVRDWSEEGSHERSLTYTPLIDELLSEWPMDERDQVRVLVPGTGLGRLAWEIAKLGFYSEGNEFSFYMLLTSNFILNKCTEIGSYTIHPFIHTTSNNMSVSDQLRPVHFPDVLPSDLPRSSRFSMCAGDFMDVYSSQKGEWDCVVTCFFLDTAHNICEYVECVYEALKPGGLWLNLGPLLYHYADIENEVSIELTYEELKAVIQSFGFDFEKESRVATPYTANMKSMYRVVYDCVNFKCRKPPATESGS